RLANLGQAQHQSRVPSRGERPAERSPRADRELRPRILCATTAWWIHEPEYVRIRTAGELRRIRSVRISALECHARQRRGSPASGTAHRPGVATVVIARSRRQNWLWTVREPRQLLWVRYWPRIQSTLPVQQEPGRRRQCRIEPATSVSHTALPLVVS